MKTLEESLFWKKANQIMTMNNPAFNLQNNFTLSFLERLRRIAGFAIMEGPLKITDPKSAFLLSPYSLQILRPNLDDILSTGDKFYHDYLERSIQEPLNTEYPHTIEIGTNTICTRKCKSCIQGYDEIEGHQMDDKVWDQVMEQVVKVFEKCPERLKPIIHLHWYNEPFTDPKLPVRLKEFKERGIDTVTIISNGDLISTDYAKIISKGMDLLIISAKSIKVYSKFKPFNESCDNVVCIDDSRYHDQVFGYNRCGTIYAFEAKNPKRCSKGPNIQIDCDGSIYLCCQDMGKTSIAGTVLQNNIMDVWLSDGTQKMINELKTGTFVGAPCIHCTHNYK